MGNVAAQTVGTRTTGFRDQHMSLRRVLVVEDEMVVAMLVEDMIADLGYEVAGVVSRVDDAMALVDTDGFDLAVLDVHLNGRLIFPFADALAERHIPFLFATAYGERGIPREHSNCPVIQKPVRAEDLKRALARLEPAQINRRTRDKGRSPRSPRAAGSRPARNAYARTLCPAWLAFQASHVLSCRVFAWRWPLAFSYLLSDVVSMPASFCSISFRASAACRSSSEPASAMPSHASNISRRSASLNRRSRITSVGAR